MNTDDPRLKGFLKSLLHQAIHGLLHRSIWGLPACLSFLLLIVAVGAVIWFGLY